MNPKQAVRDIIDTVLYSAEPKSEPSISEKQTLWEPLAGIEQFLGLLYIASGVLTIREPVANTRKAITSPRQKGADQY